MLYVVGKFFLSGLSFDIVYNESVHENINKYRCFSPTQVQKKNINLFKNRDGGVSNSTYYLTHTHTHLNNMGDSV